MRRIMSGRGFVDCSENGEQTDTQIDTHTHTQRGSYRVHPGLKIKNFTPLNWIEF